MITKYLGPTLLHSHHFRHQTSDIQMSSKSKLRTKKQEEKIESKRYDSFCYNDECRKKFYPLIEYKYEKCQKCEYKFARMGSQGERSIAMILNILNIKFIAQYIVRINGNKRFFDFYIPKYNLFIEFDGEQHFKYIKYFHKTKNGFNRSKESDIDKTIYVLENGERIMRIDNKFTPNEIYRFISRNYNDLKKEFLLLESHNKRYAYIHKAIEKEYSISYFHNE